jgi:hypothetical protein
MKRIQWDQAQHAVIRRFSMATLFCFEVSKRLRPKLTLSDHSSVRLLVARRRSPGRRRKKFVSKGIPNAAVVRAVHLLPFPDFASVSLAPTPRLWMCGCRVVRSIPPVPSYHVALVPAPPASHFLRFPSHVARMTAKRREQTVDEARD